MKKVVSTSEVAHLFANQSQYEARTPGTGSFFFKGDTIYSYGYHFRIAKHVTNDRGQTAVLFTERGYSNSTAKHISVVRNAVWGNIIMVSTLDAGSDNRYDAEPENIFNRWVQTGEAIAEKLKKAKKPEIYLNQLDGLKHKVEKYAEFFDLEIPNHLVFLLSIEDKNQFEGYEAAKTKAAAELAERLKKQNSKATDEQIKKFRSGESNLVRTRAYGFDYLRFNDTSNRVETSQGVQIPAAIAKDFYSLVLQTISKGGCTNCGTVLMDRYSVQEINKAFIVVGCHKIEIKEIKLLTKNLGW